MRIAKLAATASALMLMVSPALAATANPASKLSVTASKSVRTGSKLKDSSNIAPAIAVVGGIAVLVGIGFATGLFDSDDDDADSN